MVFACAGAVQFQRTIGIDCYGAETADASLKGLRVCMTEAGGDRGRGPRRPDRGDHKAGCGATALSAETEANSELKDAERRSLIRDLLIATVLTLRVFVLETGSRLIPACTSTNRFGSRRFIR